jgi:hypothetical protein
MEYEAAVVSHNRFGGKGDCAVLIHHSCQHKFH